MDGSTAEWPGEAPIDAAADGRSVWIRFDPPGEPAALQAADFTTRILFDLDADASTGARMGDADARLGVELLIELSPDHGDGSLGIGVELTRYEPDGSGAALEHAQAGFFFLPTYAANTYEARLDRDALERAGLVGIAGPCAGVFRVEQSKPSESGVRWSAQGTLTLPAIDRTPAPPVALPTGSPECVRVLSQNTLYSSPLHNPGAFRRMLKGIAPDIILFQEWFNTPGADIQAWMDEHMGTGWTVIAPDPNEGVAVATRLRVIEAFPDLVGEDRAARFVGALIETPIGPILAGSIHLKCCGGAGSPEDGRRIREANAIHATVSSIAAAHPDAGVVIGGDYNLVGTRTPLDILLRPVRPGGPPLLAADTIALGDDAGVTWVDEKSRFSPGRLDWVVVDPAHARIARSFVLDTRRIAPDTLASLGLTPDDSRASDHLPVVVDLARVPGER